MSKSGGRRAALDDLDPLLFEFISFIFNKKILSCDFCFLIFDGFTLVSRASNQFPEMGGGASKKKQQRDDLAPIVPVGERNSALEEVDDILVEAVKKDWRDKILWVFSKFDRDRSGGLDVNEILELMVEIQTVTDDPLVNSIKFTYPDAKLVLAALDADGNGTIEDSEFISWLSKGLAMTPDQFENFMRSGKTEHQLATFLLGVKLYCMIEYVDEGEEQVVVDAGNAPGEEKNEGKDEEPAAAETETEVEVEAPAAELAPAAEEEAAAAAAAAESPVESEAEAPAEAEAVPAEVEAAPVEEEAASAEGEAPPSAEGTQ